MSQNIRIAFVFPEGHWLGGRNYLRNLFAAISTLPGNEITPIIFTGTHQLNISTDFPETAIITTRALDRKTLSWFLRKVKERITSRDRVLLHLLRSHDISLLSHSDPINGTDGPMRTLGWIPDFQHIHLPEFFTASECVSRDRHLLKLCVDCSKIIVSSTCARADLEAFSPQYAHKAELLRFVANPVPLSDCTNLKELQRIYNFERSYFILPNQFWAHKNHRVVITALHILKKRGKSAVVLATGSTKDYRNPAFFSSLMEYVKECEVEDSFRVLGQISFEHLGGLLRDATALINPSKFEGWSTSVEEAKSTGKDVILSDIPVHKEQAPERGSYFSPDDPEKLAQLMADATRKFDPDADAALQNRARERVPARLKEFAETYLGIVLRTTQSSN